MGKLLFDESPLVVQPTLAKAIGLNEAIVLQQINYWMNQKNAGKIIGGQRWIYNTIAEWQEQFPFWSEETVKRTIYNLEAAQLIKTGTYNKSAMDRTKWYTINFAVVDLLEALIAQEKAMEQETEANAANDALGQNDTLDVSNCYDIPETTTEITNNNNNAPVPTFNEICQTELEKIVMMFDGQSLMDCHAAWDNFPDPRRHTEALRQLSNARMRTARVYLKAYLNFNPDYVPPARSSARVFPAPAAQNKPRRQTSADWTPAEIEAHKRMLAARRAESREVTQ